VLTKNAPSPFIYRKWSGISMVEAALTRRVWINGSVGPVYPNSMILLVGKPSVGKGPAIKPAERILRLMDTTHDVLHRYEGIHIGPGDATVAGLFDEFIDEFSQKTYKIGQRTYAFSSIILIAEELAAMMHNVDNQMMGYLVKFLNCETHSQRLRGKGETQEIEHPVLHILGGVQPKMLSQIFPVVSFGMGLTARTTFVYSNEAIKIPPLDFIATNAELEKKIIHDLKRVAALTGEFKFTAEAGQRIHDWWMEEADKDKQDHPKLEGYNGKRIMHLFRLCMAHNASRSDFMIIDINDVNTSIADLLEVELDMHKIFQEMTGENTSEDVFGDLANQIKREYEKTKRPIPYHIITRMVAMKVKSYEIVSVLEAMVNQQIIEEVATLLKVPGAKPKAYIPGPGML